ncbi:MAG: radical SAM family heme chaperone HemW [Thermaerobacter sp.]|nr:radical SAM family heme chaperone HemW [Thermaerobacter sp.]
MVSRQVDWVPKISDWGLYIHIPFCQARCTYCDFNTVTAMGVEDHPQYVEAILAEWEGAQIPDGTLVSVFFGGGTPSLLHPDWVAKILARVARRTAWAQTVEVTLEANPGTLTADRLSGYRAAGVNRLSIGAQALQPHHLIALNRIHGPGDIVSAMAEARAAGFANVSFDAIYGLPGQTWQEWQATVQGLLQMRPDHLSLYQLQVETGTPLAEGIKQGQWALPAADLTAEMAVWAEETLPQQGFQRYEISNFCRPGHSSRHNTLYWTLNPYLGLGAGAHSFGAGRRWWNARGVRRYQAAALAGDAPAAGEERLSLDEEMRQYVWLGLRMSAGIDPQRFFERFAYPVAVFEQAFDELSALGLLDRQHDAIRLTARGRDLANVVARRLLDAEVKILDIGNCRTV